MKRIDYPNGHTFHSSLFSGGHFWVVTRPAAERYQNGGQWTATRDDGFARVVDAPRAPIWFFGKPSIVDLPAKPGVSFAFFTPTESYAIHLETGKRFKVTDQTRPLSREEGGPAEYSDLYEWKHKIVGPYKVAGESKVREVYNDHVVVMTGSAAAGAAALVMGPTAAAAVLETKGLRQGHVVCYARSGGHRVMRLGSKNNAISLALAADGLTFLACCLRSAFVFDFDV